jgi:hypothetical protein
LFNFIFLQNSQVMPLDLRAFDFLLFLFFHLVLLLLFLLLMYLFWECDTGAKLRKVKFPQNTKDAPAKYSHAKTCDMNTIVLKLINLCLKSIFEIDSLRH